MLRVHCSQKLERRVILSGNDVEAQTLWIDDPGYYIVDQVLKHCFVLCAELHPGGRSGRCAREDSSLLGNVIRWFSWPSIAAYKGDQEQQSDRGGYR